MWAFEVSVTVAGPEADANTDADAERETETEDLLTPLLIKRAPRLTISKL